VKHHFVYPVYFYRFDLDDLPELDRTLPGFGYNRFSMVRMDDRDFLCRGDHPLRDKLTTVLQRIGHTEPVHRIELISFARTMNIIFRPVSFFVCYNDLDEYSLILAEVHNTFGETHLYVLKDPDVGSETLCYRISKAFHVSPFFDMNGTYRICFKDTGQTLHITIELSKSEYGDTPVLFAGLTGQGRPLTPETLRKTLLAYPFNAMLHLPRILRQAVTLYVRKKLPVFTRPVPRSEYTLRKQAPSWLARQGMSVLRSLFKASPAGAVTVTLPEGERTRYGAAESGQSVDLQVRDYRFFSLLARAGEIGFGMAYEQGYWGSSDLVRFMDYMLTTTLSHPVRTPWYASLMKGVYLAWHLRNRNTLMQAKTNINRHYDLSNAMYALFLDETLTYSCAIFDHEDDSLTDAQLRKLDRILDKACLAEHHHMLEIGTGWGTLAMRAVTRFGCRVTSITLSSEQQTLAQQRIAEAGLSDRIEVRLCDYRHVTGHYDRIVSVEMLEAVGKAYFPAFFQRCDRLLKPDGLLVLQTITIPDQHYRAYSKTTDWMRLYIFPGGLLPSLTAVTQVLAGYTSLVIKQVDSIGPHYALTLARWRERFLANREKILELGFPETFIRRWEYYFSYCQVGFAQHYIDDLQIVMTRPRNRDLMDTFERSLGRDRLDTDAAP
jgi:cyclopropane-fatty-acyl-phospholipid synthase